MSDQAAFAAFNGRSVTLPSGKIVRGKVLGFEVAMELLELLTAYQEGGALKDTVTPMLAKFFPAVGLTPKDVAELTLGEVFDFVRGFFYQRRWPAPEVQALRLEPTGLEAPAAPAPPAAAATP